MRIITAKEMNETDFIVYSAISSPGLIFPVSLFLDLIDEPFTVDIIVKRFYLTGKYPTFVTIDCPSELNIQSIYSFNAPVGLLFVYIYKYRVIG